MIDQQHPDIHTVTMDTSLSGYADPDPKAACQRIYNETTCRAEHLVATGETIERELDIPIVNKRISVTLMTLITGASEMGGYIPFAAAVDSAVKSTGVNFIGGFSALVQKGAAQTDKELITSIPKTLAVTDFVCSSVNVDSARAGINMDAVAEMNRIIKDTAERTADRGGLDCARLVIFYNAVEDNPFMTDAFHGVGEPDYIINVGVSSPGVVHHALKDVRDQPFDVVTEAIKETAFRMTRMGQLVAQEADHRLDVPFGIVDLSLAPTPAIGDSVVRILGEMDLETCSTHGTTTTLALLNDAVKRGGVMASSHVGDLSGAFIPVSEDEDMIAIARSGTLHLDKLEVMICVCPVGLDMIAVPGDTAAVTLSAVITDETAIDMINSKTTAVRLIPAPGKVAGDTMKLGDLLGSAPVMPVHAESSSAFVARGSRIPTPIQSLKN